MRKEHRTKKSGAYRCTIYIIPTVAIGSLSIGLIADSITMTAILMIAATVASLITALLALAVHINRRFDRLEGRFLSSASRMSVPPCGRVRLRSPGSAWCHS